MYLMKQMLFSLAVCLMAGMAWLGCTGSGGSGDACDSSADCDTANGFQCYSASGSPPGTCVGKCASDDDCDAGSTCTALAGESFCIDTSDGDDNKENNNDTVGSTNNSTT
ncbi:MAG: hypothetical protein AAFS10_17610, partial [Myxococcota bacterium]